MRLKLQNTDVRPIHLIVNRKEIRLKPTESIELEADSNTGVSVELRNPVRDRFRPFWYCLTSIFALEKMRTVLVLDGLYSLKPAGDDPLVKVKTYEYVFSKDMSYDTFVFHPRSCQVVRQQVYSHNSRQILRRAKLLYLFGGWETLFPIATAALTVCIAKLLSGGSVDPILTPIYVILAILFGKKYFSNLSALKAALEEKNIQKYLMSDKSQFRSLVDDLAQESLDANSKGEEYA